MENVKNLVGKKHKPQFDLICEELEKIGYNNYWKVLDGKDFGVPQQRERVMMISIRKDIDVDKKFNFIEGKLTNKTLADIIEDKPRKKVKKSLEKYFDEKYFSINYKSEIGIKKLFDGCSEGYFTS